MGETGEVSCRAFSFFRAAEREGVCRLDELVAGLPVSLATLNDAGKRVPWDQWAELCDRFAAGMSDDEIVATGRFGLSEGFASFLTRILRLFAEPAGLYHVTVSWAAPSIYRCVDFAIEEETKDSLVVVARLRPGFRPSRAWFLMLEGGLRVVPAFVGRPVARSMHLSVDGTHTRIRVMLDGLGQAKLLSRVWRTLRALRSSSTVANELAAQQAEIAAALEDTRQANESFADVLHALPVGVAVHAHGRIDYVNGALAALVAMDPATLVGRPLGSLFLDDERTTAAAVGSRASAILRLRSHDGSQPRVSVRTVRDVAFRGALVDVLLLRDVSAELAARERLARSDATLRALIETQPDLVLRVDRELRLVDAIPGAGVQESLLVTSLVGHKIGELLVHLPQANVPETIALLDDLRHSVAAGAPLERVLVVPAPDGQRRALRCSVTPILDGAEAIVLVRDETNQRETERRLAEAERLASLGTLAAGVAHEINNPLTYMMLAVDGLRELAERLPADQRPGVLDVVANLEDGGQRIRDTVSRMQALLRARRVEGTVSVNVKEAVDSAVAITAHETRYRARVEVDVSTSRDVGLGSTELGQVLINLIVNAAHAIDAAGPGDHRICVSARDDGDTIVVSVRDSGTGIAPEHVARVFEPFFTTKGTLQGTGLGLAIVQRIVHDAHGTIEVESALGRGTTFLVRLPAHGAPLARTTTPAAATTTTTTTTATATASATTTPTTAETTPAATTAATRGAHVWIIDDEPAVARMLSRALAGHDVRVFHDARKALDALLAEAAPDVVFCDLMMPSMSGADLYLRVRDARPTLLPRLIFLTGGAFTGAANELLERSDVAVLYKPVAPSALRAAVARALAHPSA